MAWPQLKPTKWPPNCVLFFKISNFEKNDTEINEHQHGHEAGATFYALTQAHHLEPRSVCRLSTRSTRDRSSPAVLQQLAAALQPGFTPMVWVCAQNWAIYPKERKTLKGMLSKEKNWVIYIYIYIMCICTIIVYHPKIDEGWRMVVSGSVDLPLSCDSGSQLGVQTWLPHDTSPVWLP